MRVVECVARCRCERGEGCGERRERGQSDFSRFVSLAVVSADVAHSAPDRDSGRQPACVADCAWHRPPPASAARRAGVRARREPRTPMRLRLRLRAPLPRAPAPVFRRCLLWRYLVSPVRSLLRFSLFLLLFLCFRYAHRTFVLFFASASFEEN